MELLCSIFICFNPRSPSNLGTCRLKQQRSCLEPDSFSSKQQVCGSELQWYKKNLEHCCSELKFSNLEPERSPSEHQTSSSELHRSSSEHQTSSSELQRSHLEHQTSSSELQSSHLKPDRSRSYLNASCCCLDSSLFGLGGWFIFSKPAVRKRLWLPVLLLGRSCDRGRGGLDDRVVGYKLLSTTPASYRATSVLSCPYCHW